MKTYPKISIIILCFSRESVHMKLNDKLNKTPSVIAINKIINSFLSFMIIMINDIYFFIFIKIYLTLF